MKRTHPQADSFLATGAIGIALVFFAVTGCVRVPTEAEQHKIVTRLISATANGVTILRWDSRPDLEYTVVVAERFTAAQWKPLANASHLRGTGKPIELRVTEIPGQLRTYKLVAVPVRQAVDKR